MKSRKMVRVSSKGQIVLPKGIRDRAGITEGDYIIVQELEDGLLLIGKPGASPLDTIAKGLRETVESSGFTREDLEQVIEDVRHGRE